MTNEDIIVKLTEHKKEIGSLKHRVTEIEEQNNTIQQLALSVKELAINMQNMLKEQEKQNSRINALETKPAERWNTLITVIITAIASGVITYIISNLL